MALNVFKYCTGLRIVGSFMILVVLGIVGVTYYAIVFCTYGPDLLLGGWSTLLSLVVLPLFHGLLFMLLWSYFATVFTDPGSVPDGWSPLSDDQHNSDDVPKLSDSADNGMGNGSGSGSSNDANASLLRPPTESETLRKELERRADGRNAFLRTGGEQTVSMQGDAGTGFVAVSMEGLPLTRAQSGDLVEVRRCKKCLQYKPPRTHHCSVCGRCILKMDHHCVWVVNCVGARNYKAFLLFMAYTCVESFVVTIALLPKFIHFFANIEGDVPDPGNLAAIFLAFVLNLAFAISLLGFMAMHVSLVLHNTTTIEAFEKSKIGSRWKYDVGRQRNLEQVLGRDKKYWLLPKYSMEDIHSMPELTGLHYPCKTPMERHMPPDDQDTVLSMGLD